MIELHRFNRAGLPLDEGAQAPPDPDTEEILWVDVVDPTGEELHGLSEAFQLHELAGEDAVRVGHPPKLETFDTHLFLIVHTPSHDDGGVTRKLAIFLGDRWIITILRLPVENLAEVMARLRSSPGNLATGPAKILYQLVDAMTDGFEQEADRIADRLSDLEVQTQEGPSDDTMRNLLDLRNELTGLARTVRSQRDVAALLARSTYEHIPEALIPYLRDVFDHLLRVHDRIEAARDALLGVRDLYLALVNNRLSEVMRVLAVIATVMMPLSLLAGVWGMNVGGLPGTKWRGAFWVLAAVILANGVAMVAWFRRKGWI